MGFFWQGLVLTIAQDDCVKEVPSGMGGDDFRQGNAAPVSLTLSSMQE